MHASSLRAALRALLALTFVTSAGALAGGLAGERSASACAILPSNASDPPSMLTERVLILYDRPQELEHFLREVRFQRVKARFAFLVPTPSRPEIAKVEKAPFDELAETFSFVPPPEPESGGFFGVAAKAVVRAAPVEVLEVKRVGSFTAFVLSATDGQALDQWLKDNDIARPGNTIPWLQHFVDLKFYFTALRYEPPGADGPDTDKMMSETVRLSFKSPEAYYPYLEPTTGAVEPPGRDLRVWTISQEKLFPVARRAMAGHPIRWGSAWLAGHTYEQDRAKVAGVLPGVATLLPSGGDLAIQTFEDTKASREGWGDVVLAPEGQDPDSPTWRARATALLGGLDTALHTDPRAIPGGPDADALRVAYATRGCACEAGPTGPSLGALMAIGAALLGAARRRTKAKPRRAARLS